MKYLFIKAYAESGAAIGGQGRARGRAGESQSDFYRRTGTAFGQRITGMNGRRVRNMNTTAR